MSTAIGSYTTWTDPNKSNANKVVNTVAGVGIGQAFGTAAKMAPNKVKKRL